MRRFIPSQIDEEIKIVKGISFPDLVLLTIGMGLFALVLASGLVSWAKILLVVLIGTIAVISVVSFDLVKGYKLLLYGFMYLFRKKKFLNVNVVNAMDLQIEDGYAVNNGKYVSVVELNGIDFSILEEKTQDEYIGVFSDVIKEIRNGKIIKLEKPLDLSKYIEYNESLLDKYFEEKTSAEREVPGIDIRMEMLNNQNEYLNRFQYIDRIVVDSYYLVIVENNIDSMNTVTNYAVSSLKQIGLSPVRLDKGGLTVFTDLYLKNDVSGYFESDVKNDIQNGEKVQDGEEDRQQTKNQNLANSGREDGCSGVVTIEEKSASIRFNGKSMRIIALGKYPYFVNNAWGYEIFSIPGTKVVFNFSEYPNKNINKRISRSMTELNTRMSNRKTREDERKKLLVSWQSLDALLESLDFDSERFYNTECYLMYPKTRHREIMKILRGKGIKINDLIWQQYDGWISTNPFVSMPSKNNRERVSGMQSSSIAGIFPFVSKMLNDDNGFYLGGSSRYPVFFNQFIKTGTRVNHNMVVFGKSGGGKSFFMKKLAMRSGMENKKIFILDPDNEYDYLCNIMNGNWIDVAGERAGRMNPLQVFASMKDDAGGNVGDVASHKLFLDEFFRTVLPEMEENCRLYLNECIAELYNNFNISDLSVLTSFRAEDFPTFEDLYSLILEKKKDVEKSTVRETVFDLLALNIKQFVGDGIYARLWNGYTTLNIRNDFNVLNFQSLFANNNTHIANGQMLLLMRFLNQEVIKNRELNLRGASKKIEVWIDEAHRFIDPAFPVALKFMSTMAKQIRKYDGALIVATQNIADFVGVSDSMKAMATAVINSCQYSMIFGLLANDINQIKALYANYNGGFTAQEIEFIGHARQGDALFIVDTNTRIPLHIELYDGEIKYILPETMRNS